MCALGDFALFGFAGLQASVLLQRESHCRCSIAPFLFGAFFIFIVKRGPPLWSSGRSFWLQIQRSRVRFPALPYFLSSGGSGTGSTQPREVN